MARVLERLHRDRLDEHAALLAQHWDRAGEPLTAARWLARAAGWVETSDYRQSYAQWKGVAELTRPLVERGAEDSKTWREASELLAQSAHRRASTGFRTGADQAELEAVFEEGRSVLERLEDFTTLAALTASYAQATQNTGDIRRYYELTHESRRLAARSDDPSAKAVAEIECGASEWVRGELGNALASAERGLALIGSAVDGGAEPAGYSLYPTCNMIWTGGALGLGRLRECRERIDEFLEVVRVQGNTLTMVWARVFQVCYLELVGDVAPAGEVADDLRRLADGDNSLPGGITARGYIGVCLCLAERWAEAEEELVQARALSERHVVSRELMPMPLAHLAEAELHTKGPEAALATTEQTLRLCNQWGARLFGLRNELAQVRVLRAMGGASLARAAETVNRGLAHAERMEAHAWIPHFKQERAELARDRGDTQSYRTELNEAIALWREMGASGWAERATRNARRAVDPTA